MIEFITKHWKLFTIGIAIMALIVCSIYLFNLYENIALLKADPCRLCQDITGKLCATITP